MKSVFERKMKTSKIVSVLTSAALAGSMILGALPFAGSAAYCPVGLEMVSEKTTFTLEEVRSGEAQTVVYVDSTTAFSEDELVSCVQFELQPQQWGAVDPLNFDFCSTNDFSTDRGNKIRYFNTVATSIGSIWDETVPTARYSIMDFSEEISEYSDDYRPVAIIMSDSNTGHIRADEADSDNYIAQFDIKLPADLAPGEYTIDFVNASVSIGELVEGIEMETVEITDAKGITIVVEGDGTEVTQPATEVTTTTTEETTTTTTTTEVTTTEETTYVETDETTVTTTRMLVTTTAVSWNFAGECEISAETGVYGTVGDKVQVPVYIDTFGNEVLAMAAKVVYDHDALQLTRMLDPLDVGYDYGGLEVSSYTLNKSTGVFLIMSVNTMNTMENTPEIPIVVLEFTILDCAYGEYEITFENNVNSEKEIEVIKNIYSDGSENDYLLPTIKPGSVVVGDEPAVTTTKATTVTTTTTTTSTTTTTTTTTTMTTTVTTTVTTQLTAVKGDVNSDWRLNVSDIVMVQKYLLGIRVRGMNLSKMDMNSDGRYNIFDFALIKRAIVYGY